MSSLRSLHEQLLAANYDNEDTQENNQKINLESVIAPLKLALKTANTRVSSAGLSCTRSLFELFEANSSHTATQHEDAILKTAISSLVPIPGLIAYLGDSKGSTRELAAKALLHAGKAAINSDLRQYQQQTQQSQPDHQIRGQADNALTVLDKLVKEQGFGSKNSRVKEQVIEKIHHKLKIKANSNSVLEYAGPRLSKCSTYDLPLSSSQAMGIAARRVS